ncbi:hypothetical protein HY640_02685 [Candidatus Woesearchaeota archaeon]|nr:hypothetical protein [Candidatus Woesearchaeota archaeon]
MAKKKSAKGIDYAEDMTRNLNIAPSKFKPKIVFGKVKRKLSVEQEFEIMKLVLDKFLWLGFGIMAYGLYRIYTSTELRDFYVMLVGASVLLLFIWILVREYEVAKF